MKRPLRMRRRNYLINKKFQLKYAGLILVFMFIIGLLSGYTVYYTGWLLMGEKLSNVYPQGRYVAIMRTINATLLIRLFILAPFVVLLAIFVSHRIAGPLFRIERFLGDVAQGDLSQRLTLRKKDELKELAGAINEMTDSLKDRANRLKGAVNMTDLNCKKLMRTLGEGTPDINTVKTEAADLQKSLQDVNECLSEYRLSTVED